DDSRDEFPDAAWPFELRFERGEDHLGLTVEIEETKLLISDELATEYGTQQVLRGRTFLDERPESEFGEKRANVVLLPGIPVRRRVSRLASSRVVADVFGHDAVEVPVIEHQDVVEALATERAEETLADRVHVRRTNARKLARGLGVTRCTEACRVSSLSRLAE